MNSAFSRDQEAELSNVRKVKAKAQDLINKIRRQVNLVIDAENT